MIFRPIQNLIWICGWRLDLQVDPMKIRFIIFSKTTIEDVRAGHSVLIVEASWSRSSQQSLTVQAIIQEYVQAETIQLGAKTTQLMEKLNVIK